MTSVTTTKPSSYYLKLFTIVLKRKCLGYRLITDVSIQKVALSKPSHPAIIWFPIDNADFVRDLYVSFRLCGDNIFNFVKHCRALSHEEINEGIDSTPPSELDYVSKFN